MPTENTTPQAATTRGSNNPRSKAGGGRPKGKKTTAADATVQAEIAAANKKIAEHAARGAAPGGNDEVEVQRLERPKGEAGDGFNLRVAMGLEDDAELYEAIVVCNRRGEIA
ncbi:hypothetical protein B0H10DRAFT_2221363 [Mycena sp. CBHHK59/15]|nr:hypothetical protein B0H10DRAFT_2221363 [Mycena sp. CBHHK59/15]